MATSRRGTIIEDIIAGRESTLEPETREEYELIRLSRRFAKGGGASSWNDLKDKPFEDNTVVYYEGNDLYSKCEKVADPEAPDGFFFKLSENVPSADDFIGVTSITNDGYVYTFAEHDIVEADGYVDFADIFYLVSNETPFYGVTLGRGIWTWATLNDESFFTKIYKESIKKIEPKFLGNIIDVYEGAGAKIYHDSTGENAVTKAELKSMIDNGCIIRIMTEDSCKIPYLYNFEEEWAILTFGNPEGGWNFRYTAEKEEK